MNEELYNTISFHLKAYRDKRIELLKKCKTEEDYCSDEIFNLGQVIEAIHSIMLKYLDVDEYITQLEAQILKDKDDKGALAYKKFHDEYLEKQKKGGGNVP